MSHQLDKATGRHPRPTCPTCESRLVELSEMRELAFQRGREIERLQRALDAETAERVRHQAAAEGR